MDLTQAVAHLTDAASRATQAAEQTTAALADLRSAVGANTDKLDTLEGRLEQNANTSLQSHEQTRREVARLATRVEALEKTVHGSDPPPPPADGEPSPIPLADMAQAASDTASNANLEVASLEGRMIAGFATLEKKLADRDAALAGELRKQSNAMGIGRHGIRRLLTPQNRTLLVQIATLAGAAYAAFHVGAAPQAAEKPALSPTAIAR